jgi:hypothetical protein
MNNEEPVQRPLEHLVGRWYSVTRDGLACLCLDKKNAEEMAAQCDRDYPRHAPHKAMRLVDADGLDILRAENERLREVLSGAVTVLDSLRTYGLAKYDFAYSRAGSLVYVAPTIDEAKELLTPNA